MADQRPEPDSLLERAAGGDTVAWGALLMQHEGRLRRMAAFRMDPRLAARIDAGDVIQDAFLEATANRAAYFRQPSVPLFLWLRGVVRNKLLELHRRHLGTRKRDAGRESAPPGRSNYDATSIALLDQLSGHATGPGTAVVGAEVRVRLHAALEAMDPIDREALMLRHFEQLTNDEAAQELGIQKAAAAKRYIRALQRLRRILADTPGGLTGLRS